MFGLKLFLFNGTEQELKKQAWEFKSCVENAFLFLGIKILKSRLQIFGIRANERAFGWVKQGCGANCFFKGSWPNFVPKARRST